MHINEVKWVRRIIPDHIVAKAMEMGCHNPKYIYKNGEYPRDRPNMPATNLGGNRGQRMTKLTNLEEYKRFIEDDWVVFVAKSYANEYPKNYFQSQNKVSSPEKNIPKDLSIETPKSHYLQPNQIKTPQVINITIKDSVLHKSPIGGSEKEIKPVIICPYCKEEFIYQGTPLTCPNCKKRWVN